MIERPHTTILFSVSLSFLGTLIVSVPSTLSSCQFDPFSSCHDCQCLRVPLGRSSFTTEITYAFRYNTLDPFLPTWPVAFTRLLFRFHVRCVRLDYLRYIYTPHTHTILFASFSFIHSHSLFQLLIKRDESKAHCSCHHRP